MKNDLGRAEALYEKQQPYGDQYAQGIQHVPQDRIRRVLIVVRKQPEQAVCGQPRGGKDHRGEKAALLCFQRFINGFIKSFC